MEAFSELNVADVLTFVNTWHSEERCLCNEWLMFAQYDYGHLTTKKGCLTALCLPPYIWADMSWLDRWILYLESITIDDGIDVFYSECLVKLPR